MIAALIIPRFALLVTAAGRGGLPSGSPAALAPGSDGPPVLSDVSAQARAAGVRPGMRVPEALALCPGLVLIPPDPLAVDEAAERLLVRLENLGTPVEPVGPGRVLLETRPVERLSGGLGGVLRRVRACADPLPARLGAAPGRFPALAAARRARSSAPLVLQPGGVPEALARLPLDTLAADAGADPAVVSTLERVGLTRLGSLAALDRLVVRDRFGPEGERLWHLARGDDPSPLRPRAMAETLRETLELPEAAATEQALAHALRVLVERLLARPERRGREPRTLRLGARLVGGGSWGCDVALREPTADRARLGLALEAKLRRLPAPAASLSVELGDLDAGNRQSPIFREAGAARTARLEGAVGQLRSALGEETALRVVEVDGASRLPERRFGLVPR